MRLRKELVQNVDKWLNFYVAASVGIAKIVARPKINMDERNV